MKLFGLEIQNLEPHEILEKLERRIENEEKTFVATVNAQILLRAKRDPVYWNVLNEADLLVVDGFGVQLALKLKYGESPERYPGIDLMRDLLSMSKIKGWGVYLLGARHEVVERLSEILKNSGINVLGYHHGYFTGRGPVEEITSLKPDIVFVAMGAPKQEEWIYSNLDEFEKGIFLGVGGSFDVLSGFKKRAPEWMRKSGLEWLYRFLQSPMEKWRVPLDIMVFIYHVLLEVLK